MKTIFISRLNHANSQQFVYDFFVKAGFTPEDVMVVCKRGEVSNQALVRFATDDMAWQAVKALDGKAVGHKNLKVFLAHEELAAPTDPRWSGRWMHFEVKPA
jgi:hypothetical protein